MTPRWRDRLVLAAALLLAAALRVQGFRWDSSPAPAPEDRRARIEHHLHPDERFLTMVASAVELPSSPREYLDPARSPLNPHNKGFDFFAYGTLPILVTRALAEATGSAGYDEIHLVGRAVSAAASLVSLLFLFALARRLYGGRTAALACLLLALAVLDVQQAHFFTVDSLATAFATAALWAAVRVGDEGRKRHFALFGLLLAGAMASKLSIVTLALVGAAAAWSLAGAGAEGRRRAVPGLVLAAAVAVAAFRLLQPYAFAGPALIAPPNPAWLDDVREVGEMMSGVRDMPPGHQWAGRTPLWFPWRNMVLFGLGPLLGLAAWIGWAWAGWRLFRHRERRHLLPWLWVTLLFAHQGTQWVMSMRYLLPIYPALALLAAWLLVELVERGAARGRLARLGAVALALLVVAGTAAWAWAFSAIYRRPHSRVAASHWIVAHVPAGAAIANETWDDALPLAVDRQGLGRYRPLDLHHVAEDEPRKLEELVATLDRADFLVVSSNRIYDSLARLPMRFPVTLRYYRALFSGELGFARVAEHTSYPTLAGWEIPDQGAEEAFTVYDHPRVQIFAKTAAWNPERARRLLHPGDWEAILQLTPRELEVYRSLEMEPERRERQRSGGTWSRRDPETGARRPGSFGPSPTRWPLLRWIVVVELLGLIGFALAAPALRGLPDRGWLLARSIGLLVLATLAWIAASLALLPFTPLSLWLLVALLAAAGGWRLHRQRREMGRMLRARWRSLLAAEALFWGFFLLLLALRTLNPDLWHPARGGEKPMDLAYLNATVRSTFFPPYDPWFAGGYLNYYYFGFVISGALSLLAGVPPTTAYNLLLPTFFALTACGAAAVVGGLVGYRRGWRATLGWGALGAAAVTLAGNLGAGRLLLERLAALSPLDFPSRIPGYPFAVRVAHGAIKWLAGAGISWGDHSWYWAPSRAIPHPPEEPGPITEFPFFTFLFGDLHAHLMALPVMALLLALLTAAVRGAVRRPRPAPSGAVAEATLLALLAMVVGMLPALNAWDLPAGLLLTGLGLLLAEAARRPMAGAVGAAAWRWALVAVAGRVLFHPFHEHFATTYTRLQPWTGSRTPLAAFLVVHGLFLLPLLVLFVRERGLPGRLARLRASAPTLSPLLRRPSGAREALQKLREAPPLPAEALVERLGLALALLLLLAGRPLEGLLVTLGGLAGAVLVAPRSRPELRLTAGLTVVGAALAGAVEHVVLAGDVGRMNTVFKLYLQVWVLWAIAATAAIATLRPWLALGLARHGRRRAPRLVLTALCVLLGAACFYPVAAVPARLRDRIEPAGARGLDGRSFMAAARHHEAGAELTLRWDLLGIRWLEENVVGSPVVLEATLPPYHWGSRVSAQTGLPTVIGWDWHQRQQRAIAKRDPVGRRVADVGTIYGTTDRAQALSLLARYGVRYVWVGELERLAYPAEGLAKFAAGPPFREVYRNPGVRIYSVGEPAAAPSAAAPSGT